MPVMAPRIGLARRAKLARAAFAIVSVGAALASILVAPGLIGLCGAGLALTTGRVPPIVVRHFLRATCAEPARRGGGVEGGDERAHDDGGGHVDEVCRRRLPA